MKLILYSKPGCHLCEGLQEKLEQIYSFDLELEVRDITTREDWFQVYQYEIPVLFLEKEQGGGGAEEQRGGGAEDRIDVESQNAVPSPLHPLTPSPPPPLLLPIPRPSPRSTVAQLEQMLQKYWQNDRRE